MKLYLVRHGETVLNAQNIHQTSSTELSASGKKQAEDLANRLENIDIDLVLSSSHLRAKQTAEIIVNKIKKPLELSDLLVEQKRPTVNYHDLSKRAVKAVDYIESQTVENILVVSHGLFIRVMLGVMIFGDDLNSKVGQKLINSFHTHNSGITMLESINDKWRLLTWNDYAHLG